MKAILVDDETQSHQVLQELLSIYHPEVHILASAYNVQEAYELLQNNQPDVLFLDIELGDGLGFDLLQKFPIPEFQVVFITAHQHYALTAIDFGAFAYLLKPIGREMLDKALEKVKKNVTRKSYIQQMEILNQTLLNLQEKKRPSRMSISVMEGVLFFEIKDIIRLEAQKNYTCFRLSTSKKDLIASTNIGNYLRHFESYPEFKKVHRSHLVNLYYVEKFVRTESYLLMKNGDKVPVSRSYREEIINWMLQI